MLIPILHLKAEKSESLPPLASGGKICYTLYPNIKKGEGSTHTIYLLKKLDFKKNIIM